MAQQVYSSRKQYAIEALPNPLEFFGYIFCFTCLLAGPAFEYNDYVQSIDGSKFHLKKKGEDSKDVAKKIASEPSSIFPALLCVLISLVSMGAYLYMSAFFPIANVAKPDWIAANPSHVYRYFYTLVASFTERLKYYFAWKIAEAASVLGGFGFEGYDETGKPIGWRGVENVDIINVETACNVQNYSRNWNKRTQGWLERYTYSRTGNSLFATYFVSALWHGLYPGFFLFFMFVPVLTTVERTARIHINPLVIPGYDGRDYNTAPKTIRSIYWPLCTLATFCGMNFSVQTFNLGSWENCTNALGSYSYVPHLVITGVAVVLSVIPPPKKKKEDDKKRA
jgi:D-alanyl-lipoteichoic acid acyltransferase DltB (MBOAT superfamily)